MEKPHVQTTINQITSNATTKQNKQTNKNTRFTFQKAVQLTIFLHCTSSDNQSSSTEGGYINILLLYQCCHISWALTVSIDVSTVTTGDYIFRQTRMSHRSQAPSLSCLCRLCGLVSATTEKKLVWSCLSWLKTVTFPGQIKF